jgi:hypothetical protein
MMANHAAPLRHDWPSSAPANVRLRHFPPYCRLTAGVRCYVLHHNAALPNAVPFGTWFVCAPRRRNIPWRTTQEISSSLAAALLGFAPLPPQQQGYQAKVLEIHGSWDDKRSALEQQNAPFHLAATRAPIPTRPARSPQSARRSGAHPSRQSPFFAVVG